MFDSFGVNGPKENLAGEGIERLGLFLSGSAMGSAAGQEADQTIRYSTAPVLAAGLSGPQTAPAQQTEMQEQLNTAMNTGGPLWRPTEKLDSNKFAANTQANRTEGQNKLTDANVRMEALRNHVQELGRRMDNPAADAKPGADQGGMLGGVLGGTLAEGAAMAVGLPGAGMAVAAAVAVAKVVTAPHLNLEGQGTLSNYKTANTPTRPSSRAAARLYEYETTTAPQPGTQPAAITMNGPANNPFRPAKDAGHYDLLGARVDLAEQSLNGVSVLSLEKTLEKSPAMRQITEQMKDGLAVENIHKIMQQKGLENDGGKLSVPAPVMEVYKNQAPALIA